MKAGPKYIELQFRYQGPFNGIFSLSADRANTAHVVISNVGDFDMPDRERSFEFNLPEVTKSLPRAIGQWPTSSPA